MNMMDHDQAIRTHAAERYLLNELGAEERADFEAHYFQCTACADEVQAAFAFADNAKAVFSEQRTQAIVEGTAEKKVIPMRIKPRFDWSAWLRPAWAPLAAGLLLGVVLYQNVGTIPSLRQELADATTAQPLATVVARAATCGDDPVYSVGAADRFVYVVLDVSSSASSYTCEVRDAAGTLLFTVPVSAPPSGDSIGLLLPVTALKSGRYTVTVRAAGPAGAPIPLDSNQYNFAIERK